MDFEALNHILQSGGTPIATVIVYFLWKLDKQMSKVLTAHDTLADILLKAGITIPPSNKGDPHP